MPKNQWFFNNCKKDLSCIFEFSLFLKFLYTVKSLAKQPHSSLKTAMLYQKWARQLLTQCINWHKNSQSQSFTNKRFLISSADIYILWLYQYHDSAIHPQRNGLNLTEYLQHFIFCRHKLKRIFLSHRLHIFFCTLK